MLLVIFSIFFLQAEDGIRDADVTGVQTCALPISIFISSHFPFFEVNRRLVFDRARAWGMHLDVPAGDSMRWRPGERQVVRLVAFGGRGVIRGFNHLTDGPATPERLAEGLERVRRRRYGHRDGVSDGR